MIRVPVWVGGRGRGVMLFSRGSATRRLITLESVRFGLNGGANGEGEGDGGGTQVFFRDPCRRLGFHLSINAAS